MILPRNLLKLLIFFALILSWGCLGETEYDAPECGNGVREGLEECDDGNLQDGDGCSRWCTLESSEDCMNLRDDDGDGLIDCDDPDCDCPGSEICGDSLDNDGDGLIDCDDPDCTCARPEQCSNGKDDDGDGDVDCDDADCNTAQACGACPVDHESGSFGVGDVLHVSGGTTVVPGVPCFEGTAGVWRFEVTEPVSLESAGAYVWIGKEEVPYEWCELDDVGCATDLEAALLPPGVYRAISSGDATISFGVPSFEDCANGWDDDLDGLTDCNDPECQGTDACPPPEDCFNGLDDDHDGLADCDDADCAVACAPPEECANGEDDDLDSRTDCHDMDCAGSPACQSQPCITNRALGIVEPGQSVDATFSTLDSTNFVALSCGGTGPDFSLEFVLDSTATVVVDVLQDVGNHSWALVGGTPDGGVCTDGELVCHGGAGVGMTSSDTFSSLGPGTYHVILDTVVEDASGQGTVRVSVYEPGAEVCTNGLDDDGDGLEDCDDPDCASYPTCAGESVCHGGIDDDGDGLTDCSDPDCMQQDHCATSGCSPDVDLGTLEPGGVLARHVSPAGTAVSMPCASGDVPVTVLGFTLQQESRVRVRLVPDDFGEPAMLLAVPAGSWTGCLDGPYMCVNVPGPGMSADVTTPDVLPPGDYFLVVAPYDSYSIGDALVIVRTDTD